MSKISLAPNASGTGNFTIASPNSSTDRTLTLPDNTGTVLTTASTFAGTGPAFSAYSSAGTSISATTWTKITYDTEEFDTNNNFSSSRFTPTVAGYYQVNASILWNTTSANERVVAIYKNGTSYKWGFDIQNIANINSAMSILVYLNGTTDYIEVYGYSATTITSGANSNQSYFQASLVRGA